MDFEEHAEGFRLACPKCGRWHEFNWSEEDTVILNGNLDDNFVLLANSTGISARFIPQFVCRNLKCDFTVTLEIAVDKEK